MIEENLAWVSDKTIENYVKFKNENSKPFGPIIMQVIHLKFQRKMLLDAEKYLWAGSPTTLSSTS